MLPLVLFVVGYQFIVCVRNRFSLGRPRKTCKKEIHEEEPVLLDQREKGSDELTEVDDADDWPDWWHSDADVKVQTPSTRSSCPMISTPSAHSANSTSCWSDVGYETWQGEWDVDTSEEEKMPVSDLVLGTAQLTMESDANTALSIALASGDEDMVDSILFTSSRLCGAPWAAEACGKMRLQGISLKLERALDIINLFADAHRPDLAVDLWMERCLDAGVSPASGASHEPPPEPVVYAAALEACANCGDFETACRAARHSNWRAPLAETPSSGHAGMQAWLAMTRWLARRCSFSLAVQCYESARATGLGVDIATHKTLIKACVSNNDMNRADILFQDLLESGTKPDAGIFSAMIQGHRSAGRQSEAISLFELMRKHGVRVDASLYDAILDGGLWCDAPAMVEQILADMETSGVKPSTSTLSVVLKLFGECLKIDKALEVFEDLPKRHGFKNDARSYSAMISTCLQSGRLDLALAVFDRMRADHYRLSHRLQEALLRACTRSGDLERAVSIVEDALVRPDGAAAEGHRGGGAPPIPETRSLEAVLSLIGRRQEASRLGLPLIERLQSVGVQVSADLLDGLRRSAAAEAGESSFLAQRSNALGIARLAHAHWRQHVLR